jgi:dipicolinate synthase subunit A
MGIWHDLTVAILGGDARETETSHLVADAGASVTVFGCPPPQRDDVTIADSPEKALRGARVAIMPVPYNAADGSLYAPFAARPIHIRASDLTGMQRDSHLIIGKADKPLIEAAREAEVTIHEYEHDTELMHLRAPAVAEGAIRVAIEQSPLTIHDTPIGLLGYGRIGQTLAKLLISMNARVHVFARRADARAAAYALGAAPHTLEDIPNVFPELEIVYNSVPTMVLAREELTHLRRGTLVIDLAAPPGGMDMAAAESFGLKAVWARGLGASAPRTVANSQWIGIDRILRDALQAPKEDIR